MGAMEVLDYNVTLGKRDRDYEVKEAARMGIENARRLLQSLAQAQPAAAVDEECDLMAGAAISKFQKVVSLLSRTGHARFRRRPARDATVSNYAGVFLESNNFDTITTTAPPQEPPNSRAASSSHGGPSSKPPHDPPELQRIIYQVTPNSTTSLLFMHYQVTNHSQVTFPTL
jgi:hypothetical protein